MFQWLRIKKVRPWIQGDLLDVGCGNNKLCGKYSLTENLAIGIDKEDNLPVENKFDTITFVASLNYMSERERETYLVGIGGKLKKGGRVVVTCRTVGKGLSSESVLSLFRKYKYHLLYSQSFMLGLNQLYIFVR